MTEWLCECGHVFYQWADMDDHQKKTQHKITKMEVEEDVHIDWKT